MTSVLPRFVELASKYGSLTRGVLAERAKRDSAAQRHAAATLPHPQRRTGADGGRRRAPPFAARSDRQARAEAVERTGAGFRVKLAATGWRRTSWWWLAKPTAPPRCWPAWTRGSRELLGMVPYSSSMTVALGFDAADFARPPVRLRLPGSQEGAPQAGGLHLGGHQVFPSRAGGQDRGPLLPGRHGRRRRAGRNPTRASWPPSPRELQEIAGIAARPRFTPHLPLAAVHGAIHRGPPQRLAEMEARVAAIPGLYLAGNAYHGIGIPDCIRMGRAAAEGILKSA